MAVMTKWSLRWRTLILALVPALIMFVVTLAYHVHVRLADAQNEQARSGAIMATQLAASADFAVISGNMDSLVPQIDTILAQPGVVSVSILDNEKQTLFNKSNKHHKGIQLHRYTAMITQQALALDHSDWLVDAPINNEPSTLGLVEVGISSDHIVQREHDIVLKSILLGCLLLVVIAGIGFWMAHSLERPLRAIIGLVGALKNRQFTARVSIKQDGELGALAYHLNLLAAMLEESRTLQISYTEELITARGRADKASQAKSEFLAMMSHELRTPLNAISGGLQLLNGTPLSPDSKEYVNLATMATNDLRHLVDDVLDFSKMEEGRLILQPRPFLPKKLLQHLTDGFRLEAEHKKLDISLTLEGQTDLWLKGDEMRIRQILSKLLDNAIKFTEKGRIGIRARISTYNDMQAQFLCEVYDSGIGINANALTHIFEPFMQVDRSHSRRYGGAGLGLAIASRLSRLMHADLRVESEPLVGTCFCFELVLPICEECSHVADISQPNLHKSAFHAHVLVVDDNPANRKVAEAMLKSAGCTVSSANNGREALQLMAAGDIDLVLMDCQMPIMDGYEATQEWRSQERDKRLPIIALTANASADNETACLTAGMDGMLSKPFRKQQLEMLLSAWL
ncbi:response regulator [Agitococcus lubricus]|uniref:histidine kinase n=1 Tax=Agitococcus lubricus TaxID=1077255 RepID=A0A2T5J2R7_9GAMM|nr:response regulator [Agitococcus lubricus]PTQ90821.1 signal transduction histidine kinase [Agitococcus lubricus]